jgi:hypothetical protein
MLWSAMIMRVNSSGHQEKRAGALAVFLGIRYDAKAFSEALKFAISHDVPVSTLTVVLQLVEQYEQCPYEVTSGAIAELHSVASMPFVTARVLARSLLERAGVVVAMPASSEPGVALISEEQATEIELGVGRARLPKAIEIWPDFVPLFGTCFEVARASDEATLPTAAFEQHAGFVPWRALEVFGAKILAIVSARPDAAHDTAVFLRHGGQGGTSHSLENQGRIVFHPPRCG